jgi:inosose dehydratase
MHRRTFLQQTATLSAVTLLSAGRPSAPLHAQEPKTAPLIATNTYPWAQFAKRDGKTLQLHTPELLAEIASTGILGYEPNIGSVAEFDGLAARLKQHQLQMPSLYVNSVLHDPALLAMNQATVLAIAMRAVDFGTQIIVTNPSPIRWGGPENKTDEQLLHQAEALNQMGAALRKLGIKLAYHNHDAELRLGGREFHHMLAATDPAVVDFCLDAHWIYRGCGNSQVAVFDALELYGDRVIELHVRQSAGGIWTERFAAAGDLDYRRLLTWFHARNRHPLLTLEQAVETGSPRTVDVVSAHRDSHAALVKLATEVSAS